MLENYSNFYIRIFILVTVHTHNTKVCSLLSTQVKPYSSQKFFLGKCNSYFNDPQSLFERALKFFYLNKREVI